jgi:hypothetical protein
VPFAQLQMSINPNNSKSWPEPLSGRGRKCFSPTVPARRFNWSDYADGSLTSS